VVARSQDAAEPRPPRAARRRAVWAAWVGLLAVLVCAAGAGAAEAPEGWAYKLANELMSPFCPGRTLADCPSSSADTLRLWIIAQEAAGRSKADVKAELLKRYGDVMRPAPLAEGLGLAAYVAPSVVFLLGGAAVALYLRRSRRGARPPAPPTGASDPELERIIDDELAR
jgi:cytochrome c-type biogenesis protein CcmH/NrfF